MPAANEVANNRNNRRTISTTKHAKRKTQNAKCKKNISIAYSAFEEEDHSTHIQRKSNRLTNRMTETNERKKNNRRIKAQPN